MNIRPSDLVLEIGSGDNPRPRSDVLCDKIPEDDTQRGGAIVLDRPFIAADGQYLPFADKSFDYIICCHVLEHAEDPALFISELVRVGHGGYIETPTEIGERLYGWPYHKWFVHLDDPGKLIFKRKTEEGAFGQFFHHLFATDPTYARFHQQNHDLFLIQYQWSGKIDYEIVEPDSVLLDLNDQKNVEKLLGKQAKPGIAATIKRLTPARVRQKAKSAIAKGQGRHKKALQDVKSIIVCPVCKGPVQWHDDFISCQNCNRTYPIRNGIPFMIAE